MKKNKILLLLAHPSKHRSEVNTPLFELACSLDFVTAIDLYAEYPTHNIDITTEQQRLDAHDVIIFQFPLFWYSTPSILKEWQDLVLEYGYAYGKEGNALQNKKFLCAVSAGGSEQAYHVQGCNNFTLRQFLMPLEQMARVTGMEYLPPFAMFSSRSRDIEDRLAAHKTKWQNLLTLLAEGEPQLATDYNSMAINQDLSILTKYSEGQ